MLLGEILVAQGLARQADLERARERQATHGGTLGQNLTALGLVSNAELEAIEAFTPATPTSIVETGLDLGFAIALLIKTVYVVGVETAARLAEELRLAPSVVSALMEEARQRGLLEAAGAVERSLTSEVRFTLSAKGREWAAASLAQSQYVGPAPVPLVQYQRQIQQQRLAAEQIDREALVASLRHLVLVDELRDELGPAVNYGTALLLYGAPGNGKTSIAVALANLFRQRIYVPHALEVDGQVIRVFDPTVHVPAAEAESEGVSLRVLAAQADRRWVACARPIVITGGELTLEMLELQINPTSKIYEAPLQLRAANGIFVLDDFGRQRVRPIEMLNRWLLPLEHRVDYLALQTGKKFPVPFDVLVIFSTNLPPSDLMDEAMLRRIPYKIVVEAPGPEEYREIFRKVAATAGLEVPDAALKGLFEEVYDAGVVALARYHPRLIVEHVVAACRYEGVPPQLDRERALAATRHLVPREQATLAKRLANTERFR